MKRKLLAVLCWLLVWQALALIVRNSIVLAGPWETLRALWELLRQGSFWLSLLNTGLRVFGGLLLGCGLGVVLAHLAWRHGAVRTALQPVITAMKAAPVVSFVLLLLIWGGNAWLSLVISAVVVLPIVYLNTLAGFEGCDRGLLELGQVFRFTRWRRWRYLYFHALYPSWKSALQLAVGMAWKSGIAAEVIGQPLDTIGNGLYRSKIYLDTPGVLAWTVTAVLLSLLMERLILLAFDRLGHERPARPGSADAPVQQPAELCLQAVGLCKTYGEKTVLRALDFTVKTGQWWHVLGPSAIGKTTLLRHVMGLETPDCGTLEPSRPYTVSAVFQDDRLLPRCSALENVRIAVPEAEDALILADLQRLLGDAYSDAPVSAFSGGMRRRVCLVRACLSRSDLLVLDEPFAGLDRETQQAALSYARERAGGRLVLIASHECEGLEFCSDIDLSTT